MDISDSRSHPVPLLRILYADQRVAPVLLGNSAHQAYQLLVLLTVKLDLLPVAQAERGWPGWGSPPTWLPTLLQALAVALHNIGHYSVGPEGLARECRPTLGAGNRPTLACWASPVACDAGLTKGVVTREGDRLFEEVQADGTG